jgi:acetylornithine deacetylase/succinyl-diaminopimelate desuccinylase-like protein
MGGNLYFTCQNAEKGNIWLKITGRGTPGHAAVPSADNVVGKLAELVCRLQSIRFPLRPTSAVQEMVHIMSGDMPFPADFLFRLLTTPFLSSLLLRFAVRDESVRRNLFSMLRNTLTPTVIRSGSKTNVIPSEGTCEVDFRLLPGYSLDQCLEDLTKKIGSGFDIKVIDARLPSESSFDHDLVSSIRRALKEQRPDASLVPFLLPGVTDACFLRPRGISVYGFTPLGQEDDIALAHGHDERVSESSMTFGLRTVLDVVQDYACSP